MVQIPTLRYILPCKLLLFLLSSKMKIKVVTFPTYTVESKFLKSLPYNSHLENTMGREAWLTVQSMGT